MGGTEKSWCPSVCLPVCLSDFHAVWKAKHLIFIYFFCCTAFSVAPEVLDPSGISLCWTWQWDQATSCAKPGMWGENSTKDAMGILLWPEWWLLLFQKLGGSPHVRRLEPCRRCFHKLGASVSPGDRSLLSWYGMRLGNQCCGKVIPWRLCCVGWVPHSVDGVGGSFQLEQRMHNFKISPVNSQPLLVSLCTTKFSKTAPQRRELFVPKFSVLFSQAF